jgi:hypothetical protein
MSAYGAWHNQLQQQVSWGFFFLVIRVEYFVDIFSLQVTGEPSQILQITSFLGMKDHRSMLT